MSGIARSTPIGGAPAAKQWFDAIKQAQINRGYESGPRAEILSQRRSSGLMSDAPSDSGGKTTLGA